MDASLPILARRIVLRCLRDTDVGVFPEFRLGAFLQSVDAGHKNHADSIALEVPRSTKMLYRKNEHFVFHLYAASAHRARLERIEAMLRALPHSASVSRPGIAFGDNWALHGIEDLYPFGPLTPAQLDEEVSQWGGVTRFRIRLASPLRFLAPDRTDGARRGEILRDPRRLDGALLSRSLTQSLVALKFQLGAHEWRVPELSFRIVDKSLWHVGSPISPGSKHPNVFEEGLFGDCTVEWTEPPTDDHWRNLLLLARFGAGQSRAFGLGRMRLEITDRESIAQTFLLEDLASLCERLIPNQSEFAPLSRETARDAVIGLTDAGWRPRLSAALPAGHIPATGIATPESRLSALSGAGIATDFLYRIPVAKRECLRRGLRYTTLARTCLRHGLRIVCCEDEMLLFSKNTTGIDAAVASIRQSLMTEGIDPHEHTLNRIDDALDFRWCDYHFIGGLALPGITMRQMFAVDLRTEREEPTSQAA